MKVGVTTQIWSFPTVYDLILALPSSQGPDPGKKTVLLWDEDSTYTARAKPEKTIEITSPLGLTEMGIPAYVGGGDLIPVQIEYVSKEAALVHLDWGINGWNLLPQDRQPPGAAVVEGVYRLRMQREGDVFKETAWAPRGCTMNFGFLITRNRGLCRATPREEHAREALTSAVFAEDLHG